MICNNCNQQISDECAFCPYCGSAQQPAPQPEPQPAPVVEQPAPQPEPQPAPVAEQSAPQPEPQPAVQAQYQAQYQQPVGQYYPNPVSQQIENDIDTAKTLGIVALVGAFFLPLISFICGGIGLSKIKKLKPQANEQQAAKLKSAKSLCTAGIIVRSVLIVISIIVAIIVSVFAVKAAKSAYDGIKDNPDFGYNYNIDDIPDEYKQFFDNLN